MPRQSGVVPDEVADFGRRVASELAAALGEEFVGTYFVGSIALDGYVEKESDLDILAVCRARLSQERRAAIAERIFATTPLCPARGLEFTLYRLDVVGTAPATRTASADFEINVNGGPRMDKSVRLSPDGQPTFWWVLDRAIAHRRGATISGPPPGDVVADASRSVLLDAMIESMRWHRQHEKATLYSVLNATRAWYFSVEGRLVSKLEGAAWATSYWRDPLVIESAVALRLGRSATLRVGDVDALLDHVEEQLAHSRKDLEARDDPTFGPADSRVGAEGLEPPATCL